MTLPWEAYLAERLPGYLLPEAGRRVAPEDEARRFLGRIGERPEERALLYAASLWAAHAPAIVAYAAHDLPALCRCAPRAPIRERRVAAGELRGRLDVPATMARALAGRPDQIVAIAPRRETATESSALVLVRSTAVRILDLCGALRAGGLPLSGWAAELGPCEDAVRRAMARPPLRDLRDAAAGARDEEAAIAARHPLLARAARLHRALREDAGDPERAARVLAEGALAPLSEPIRFQLAVLLRLVDALAARLARRGFVLRRAPILSGRREIAELTGGHGERVRVHYDQATLAPGPCHAGLVRYFGQRGRLRPDVTVVTGAPGVPNRAVVVEAKLSDDPAYLAQGYREAHLYRAEYAGALAGWPQAILVTSSPVAGPPSREDAVIAVDWDRWVPGEVVEGIVSGVG